MMSGWRKDVQRHRGDYRRRGINSMTNRHSCFNHKAKAVRRGAIYTFRMQNESTDLDWPLDVYRQLKAADVRHVTYVPDAGHSRLINLLNHDPEVVTSVLTTEEEGIAIAAGGWVGGQRRAILMRCSGAGKWIHRLS